MEPGARGQSKRRYRMVILRGGLDSSTYDLSLRMNPFDP
jgi:hypothetical protein